MLHFKKVHGCWHVDAMHQCAVGKPCFEVDRQALLDALCKVKNGKSSGNCAHPIDLLKHHKHVQLYDALALLCEEFLNRGVPKVVNSMLIMPLYKCKGSKLDPDNYRGISLIHPVEKLLAALVLGNLEQHA